MSWMKNFRRSLAGLILILSPPGILLTLASIAMIDSAYHHYQEEHAQPASKGWQPPKIVKHENCALWDEIRKECEDD